MGEWDDMLGRGEHAEPVNVAHERTKQSLRRADLSLAAACAELTDARERASRYAADANHAENRADKAEAREAALREGVEALAEEWQRRAEAFDGTDIGDTYEIASRHTRALLTEDGA